MTEKIIYSKCKNWINEHAELNIQYRPIQINKKLYITDILCLLTLFFFCFFYQGDIIITYLEPMCVSVPLNK